MLRKSLAFLTFVSFLSACSHTVTIDTDPTGAEIKVNGEKLGTSPVTYTEQTGWERIYDIEANKGGFKTTRKQVRQTEWNMPVTAGSVIGGLFCLVPFAGLLFARQMPDRVVVSMEKTGGGDSGTPSSSYGY
jgi:hypothetical protein